MSDRLLATGESSRTWSCTDCGRRVRVGRTGPYCACGREGASWRMDRYDEERNGALAGAFWASFLIVALAVIVWAVA